jgi:putative phage-type endonuclease
MIEYIETANESAWLLLRSQNVNSTEAAALFGLSPYQTELELFHRKRNAEVQSIADNFRMRAGRYLEGSIAQLAANELDCTVKPYKVYARDADARMGSSFDYEILTGDYAGWLMEIKNVDRLVYRDAWQDNEAPEHIEVQCQHQLEMTERPGIIIAALVGGNELKFIERKRNEKMGAGIRQRIQRFWSDVEANNEPLANFERDAEFIISLHQSAGDAVYVADETDNVSMLLHDYHRLKREASDLDALAKAKKAEILDAVGDEFKKIVTAGLTVTCGMTKDTPPTLITEDMVGQTYGGRKGYRMFTLREKKA